MATLGLSKKWIDKMKNYPESGMGYQDVEVKLKNGTILKGLVFNSEILRVDGRIIFSNADIDDIQVNP